MVRRKRKLEECQGCMRPGVAEPGLICPDCQKLTCPKCWARVHVLFKRWGCGKCLAAGFIKESTRQEETGVNHPARLSTS